MRKAENIGVLPGQTGQTNVQQIPMLLTTHKLVWLHNVFFDETPNVLVHMNRYTRATE